MTPYYDDGRCVIYHGDALDVLPTLMESSVGVVLLDPPYSMVPNSFAGRDDGAAGTSGAPVALLNEVLRHTRRLLPDGGVAGLVCDWRRLPDVAYLATLNGLRLATCIAWTRNSPGTGGILRSAWDPMLVLSVGSPVARDRAAVPNTVHAEKPRGGVHPYEKPVALWSRLVDRVSPTVVLDPFAGTGASMEAAHRAGHRWVGIEVNEGFCEAIACRLSQGVLV